VGLARFVKVVAALELLALGVFVYANRRADLLMPESGGSGDGSAIVHWSLVAGASFYFLAFFCVVGVVLAWFTRPAGSPFLRWVLHTPFRGGPQLIVALPIVGGAVGILVMAIFGW
jgi:hypothetical protein